MEIAIVIFVPYRFFHKRLRPRHFNFQCLRGFLVAFRGEKAIAGLDLSPVLKYD